MQKPQDRLSGDGRVVDLAAFRDRQPVPTSRLTGGAKGKFGYWEIEFTPQLTEEQWDEFRAAIGRHNAFVGGVYNKSKCIAALLEVVPEAKILP